MTRRWRMGATLAILSLLACPTWDAAAESARDLALKGKRLLDQGDLPGAGQALRGAGEQVAKEGRPDAELIDFLGLHLYNLGVRLNNGGDADGALDCLMEALKLGRLVPHMRDAGLRDQLKEASLSVARYLIDARKPERALQLYGLLDPDAGTDARPLIGLGAARLAMDDLDGARQAFEAAAARDPRSAEAAAGMGRVALRLGSRTQDGGASPPPSSQEAADQLAAAVDWMTRARDLEPLSAARERELAEALDASSRALARTGDASGSSERALQAEAALTKAARLAPASPWLRIDLGLFLFKAHRYTEAAAALEEADGMLTRLLATRRDDREASAWRGALGSCKENEAAAAYNLAVDAINQADFAHVGEHLRRVCDAGERWAPTCRYLGEAAKGREAAFNREVEAREKNLARDPASASDLLALGDLYADVGSWDRARGYYERLRAAGANDFALRDRLASLDSGRDLREITRTVALTGSRVRLVYYREALGPDLETALKAAMLRVSSSLGEESIRGDLVVIVYPSQRAFRERAGYRVGAFVRGNYSPGRVSVYETPSHNVVEWVTVLTHEIAHHAVQRLSGGDSPRWLSEGIARYVEGDAAVIDRGRVRRRLEASLLQPLDRLDDAIDRSWNDAETHLDVRDASLLAVEEMAKRSGTEGLKRILKALAEAPAASSASAALDGIVRSVVGVGLADVDAAWRAALLRAS